jgi:hypothetical protein
LASIFLGSRGEAVRALLDPVAGQSARQFLMYEMRDTLLQVCRNIAQLHFEVHTNESLVGKALKRRVETDLLVPLDTLLVKFSTKMMLDEAGYAMHELVEFDSLTEVKELFWEFSNNRKKVSKRSWAHLEEHTSNKLKYMVKRLGLALKEQTGNTFFTWLFIKNSSKKQLRGGVSSKKASSLKASSPLKSLEIPLLKDNLTQEAPGGLTPLVTELEVTPVLSVEDELELEEQKYLALMEEIRVRFTHEHPLIMEEAVNAAISEWAETQARLAAKLGFHHFTSSEQQALASTAGGGRSRCDVKERVIFGLSLVLKTFADLDADLHLHVDEEDLGPRVSNDLIKRFFQVWYLIKTSKASGDDEWMRDLDLVTLKKVKIKLKLARDAKMGAKDWERLEQYCAPRLKDVLNRYTLGVVVSPGRSSTFMGNFLFGFSSMGLQSPSVDYGDDDDISEVDYRVQDQHDDDQRPAWMALTSSGSASFFDVVLRAPTSDAVESKSPSFTETDLEFEEEKNDVIVGTETVDMTRSAATVDAAEAQNDTL